MLIEDKDIMSYQLLLKQDRVLVNQRTCFFDQWIWFFFSFTFWKKWVGRAMGNETFYRDGQKEKKCLVHLHKQLKPATY